MEYWVATTGHRPPKLGGYENRVFDRVVAYAEQCLYELGEELEVEFGVITGMALGWDQAVAQACVNMGIPFVAAVPFRGHELKWPRVAQWRYQTLLNLAYEVVYVSDGGYTEEAMQKRNEWMVLRGERLLALWDGSESGTGNCVRYAEETGVPVVNLWEGWTQWKKEQ